MADMAKHILVVEDDVDIGRLLEIHLTDSEYAVDIVKTGNDGLQSVRSKKYDLVILDLMLPGVDGLEICRYIRSLPTYTPTLMLTAKSSEFDRVLGLEVGADDYVTKPFSVRELLARIKALFRRSEAFGDKTPDLQKPIRGEGLYIDIEKRKVLVRGHPVDLTAKEFDLLLQFALHPGRVYTRSQLLDAVWGYGHDGYEHTVNSHINRLRGKIEKDSANPHFILTVWGVGYKFCEIGTSGLQG